MMEAITRTFTPDILAYLLKGAGLTVALSVVIVLCSIVFGMVLGLLRSYATKGPVKILGILSGIYIEIFRNTPNLLWIFICYVAAPLPTAFLRSCSAFVLFTSAVIAEIIRGGLNSIAKGQFEAAASQGFSFFQTLLYIVMPQCFQRIVPTLVSQVITVIKDTSFLSGVAVMELMFRSKNILSLLPKLTGQSVSIVHFALIFGFAALIYFVINFSLSCLVRYIQSRRGKGAVIR